jgi:hypothetical protein
VAVGQRAAVPGAALAVVRADVRLAVDDDDPDRAARDGVRTSISAVRSSVVRAS